VSVHGSSDAGALRSSRLILAVVSAAALIVAASVGWTAAAQPAADTAQRTSRAALSDVCARLPAEIVRTLLFDAAGGTLDSWSNRSSTYEEGCRWQARPRGSEQIRRMVLSVTTYPSADAAQAAMPQGPAGDIASDAVVTGSGDTVVRPNTFETVARHGNTLATIDASDAQITAAPWVTRYWLDAAALSGAGASIRDVPAWRAAASAGQQDGSESGRSPAWTPPPHDPGTLGRVLAPLLALMRLLADWRFIGMIPLILTVVAVLGFSNAKRPHPVRNIVLTATVIYAFLNVMIGTRISDTLIYHLGEAGSATVTDRHGTSTQYNDQNVSAYAVLVRTAAGKVVKTAFADDDFNVYPPHNATTYPDVGDRFTVRYPAGFPNAFVIVADDGSPWAKDRSCMKLRSAAAAIQRKRDFVGTPDAALARDAAASDKALRDGGC
jgi:hypothetical protein